MFEITPQAERLLTMIFIVNRQLDDIKRELDQIEMDMVILADDDQSSHYKPFLSEQELNWAFDDKCAEQSQHRRYLHDLTASLQRELQPAPTTETPEGNLARA